MKVSVLAALFLVQSTPNYGLTPAQMSRMTVNGFLAHAEKVRKTGMPEYELRDALYTYAKANDAHIDGLVRAHSATKQGEFGALRKSLDAFLLALHEYEYAANGGGTMYLLFHATRFAEARQLVREMLENKLKDPGARVVSDGSKIIQSFYGAEGAAKTRGSLDAMQTHYNTVCASLKNRSRGHSNAVIDFCMRKMETPFAE